MIIWADYTWPSVAMGEEIFRKGLYELKTEPDEYMGKLHYLILCNLFYYPFSEFIN